MHVTRTDPETVGRSLSSLGSSPPGAPGVGRPCGYRSSPGKWFAVVCSVASGWLAPLRFPSIWSMAGPPIWVNFGPPSPSSSWLASRVCTEGQRHEGLLGPDLLGPIRWTVGGRHALDVAAVGLHVPRLTVIPKHDLQDLPQALTQRGRLDGGDPLDAAREVPFHPVGGADEIVPRERVVLPVLEIVDPRVLEKPPDHRDDADALGDARHPRRQHAEAPDNE